MHYRKNLCKNVNKKDEESVAKRDEREKQKRSWSHTIYVHLVGQLFCGQFAVPFIWRQKEILKMNYTLYGVFHLLINANMVLDLSLCYHCVLIHSTKWNRMKNFMSILDSVFCQLVCGYVRWKTCTAPIKCSF